MEMNRRIDGDIICGPFFLVAEDGDDFTSLSDEQMELCKDCFGEPEQFSDYEPDAQPRMTLYSF